jgi:hypothetical protein
MEAISFDFLGLFVISFSLANPRATSAALAFVRHWRETMLFAKARRAGRLWLIPRKKQSPRGRGKTPASFRVTNTARPDGSWDIVKISQCKAHNLSWMRSNRSR